MNAGITTIKYNTKHFRISNFLPGFFVSWIPYKEVA
jgi:hypothetical protein